MDEVSLGLDSLNGKTARRSTIVVGVDGSPSSEAAVQWAAEECHRRDARVVLVHVRQPVLGSVMTVEHRRYRALALTDTVGRLWQQVSTLRSKAVDAVGRVGDGSPSDFLIEASQTADLLVIGAEGEGQHRGLLLGEVAQRCVRDAACPVVIIPAPGGPVAA
ncbi:universal stress protein [Actinopolymorpha alba]|uniref:universal stress protein n=1 Tax=Actinopolymorpha alba TaxID=533267 RepID=UPI0003608DEB|nr:universal stress protein [Actinopolymorpha alba]